LSHFVVLVVGNDIDDQLAPYDENTDVEPYLDSLDGDWKTELENAKEYFVKKTNEDITGWSEQDILDAWTQPGHWVPSKDGDGYEHWSTYNPKSKWDWYITGGRWDGWIKTRAGAEVNECTIADVDLETMEIPFALVKDGEWYEKGRMGWWAMVSDEKNEDKWTQEVRDALKDLDPSTALTVVDCHI
jgi:hypothetical protein